MDVAHDAPKRPALRYYGGKWRLAPWVISHFPPHTNYVEPCGGAASVLLQKPPSPLETYNDLDFRLVNFFQVLRNRPDDLLRAIRLTPWSRAEFERCRVESSDPLENARRWWVLCWQSISKVGGSWRSMYDYDKRPRSAALDGVEIDHLYQVAERLKMVQIEQRDALLVIEQYDNAQTLTYFDPPYLPVTRVNRCYYDLDVDEMFHIDAAKLLLKAKGMVVVSGYKSGLYAELYEDRGWKRVDSPTVATNGSKRVESLWLSPRTAEALQQSVRQLGMFVDDV